MDRCETSLGTTLISLRDNIALNWSPETGRVKIGTQNYEVVIGEKW